VYLRFGRNPVPAVYRESVPVAAGRGNLLRKGRDLLIVACGAMVAHALDAAVLLSGKGLSVSVIDMVSVKPLDGELILKAAGGAAGVVTAEDHQTAGGLGGAVAEFLGSTCPGR
jgi:transketolase